MYLFFDVETNGLPKDWKAPVTKLDNWPRIIQFGAILTDKNFQTIQEIENSVKPDGWEIDEKIAELTGITNEHLIENGQPVINTLIQFAMLARASGCIVAHNMSFDRSVMESEFIRAEVMSMDIFENGKRKWLCTKELSTDILKLPGNYGYKWPTLQEFYNHFSEGEKIEQTHRALDDVRMMVEGFRQMVKKHPDILKDIKNF